MNHLNIEHEWDEDGNCSIAVSPEEPRWRWSHWDTFGILLHTVSNLFNSIGGGLNLLARECQAQANFERGEYDDAREEFRQEVARAEMAGALEGMILWDEEDTR